MKVLPILLFILLSLIWACSNMQPDEKLARYVGDPGNGLIQKIEVNGKKMIAQYIPGNSSQEYRSLHFRVYINTERQEADDSLMYYLNYRASDLFRLVSAGDTLSPVISERMANGMRDKHEFTVVFNQPALPAGGLLKLLLNQGWLYEKELQFTFSNNDITKASKTFNGYEKK